MENQGKGTSVPPPFPGMVLPLAEGPTPPKPPKRPPSQHRPMPEMLSLIKLLRSNFKTFQYDEALYISYGHLLSENLSEDVVRDVLTASTPGHPLAHTCRGSSTKNPTRSSALTLTITFYPAISHPRKKGTLPPMILTCPLEANRSNRYNIWILEIREDLCHRVNFWDILHISIYSSDSSGSIQISKACDYSYL